MVKICMKLKKKIINQSNKKKGYCWKFSKLLNAKEQSVQKCLIKEELKREESS